MTDNLRRVRDLGPLHDLLLKACRPDSKGFRSIPVLASSLEISAYAVYKWVAAGKIPPGYVLKIVEMSDGTVSLEDFHQFVYA